jgi:hypothetical protein
MTSQINPNNIDGSYPVAGQDNDSQGFRDNFTNIRNNFTFTKAELEDLQNKVVLKSALLNTSLSNDFAGNALVNPAFTGWRETYNNIGAVSGSVTINFTNGNFQRITMAGSTQLTFSWPSSTNNQYASIKLWVINPNASYVLSFPNSLTLGNPSSIIGFSGNTITFSSSEISNSTEYFFEIFTVDGGVTLGIRDLGRNKDFDGNNISVIGSFTANGNVILGSSTTSNAVVAATTGSTSSTTGALVVTGGVGIAGNIFATGNAVLGSSTTSNVVVAATTGTTSSTTGALVVAGGIGVAGNAFVNGNLIINNGIIGPNYLLANVVTGQNLFANVNYNRFIANCSPTGTVANLFITLPNSVEDGRIIDITSMTAITSCFVSNMTPGVTSVYGLANTWAGSASFTNSVSIKLMYNSSVGRWFKVG